MRFSRVLGVRGEGFKACCPMTENAVFKEHLNNFWEKDQQTHGSLRTGISTFKTH